MESATNRVSKKTTSKAKAQEPKKQASPQKKVVDPYPEKGLNFVSQTALTPSTQTKLCLSKPNATNRAELSGYGRTATGTRKRPAKKKIGKLEKETTGDSRARPRQP